ncbi:MAG: DNA gyrase C-terminal beta-propeller domain-containing protein, partial [Bacteroidota bacterium]
DFLNSHYIIMATKKGQVKKTLLKAYSRPRTSGINAITINEDDELLEAKLTNGESQIILGARSGMAIRFEENKVRQMGRTAAGVRGISLQDENDEVVGMVVVPDENRNVLVVSEKGYGKQTPVPEYRVTNRGGKGVKTINVSDKTGNLIAVKSVEGEEDLMIITRKGITIRMSIEGISVLGRNTQGVRLIRLKGKDEIASVAKVIADEEEESVSPEGETPEDGLNNETDTAAENTDEAAGNMENDSTDDQ